MKNNDFQVLFFVFTTSFKYAKSTTTNQKHYGSE